jgi:RimJ/RimL family protein N-acetyltransferase
MERSGMRREAHFRENEWVKGKWDDEYVYAILAREWATEGGRRRPEGAATDQA